MLNKIIYTIVQKPLNYFECVVITLSVITKCETITFITNNSDDLP
jgi:hypothetical protein